MLKFDISDSYKGTGFSCGLDRGLLVYADDVLLVEEGMGLGACALQTGGHTYFSSLKDLKKNGSTFDVTCSIDRKLELKIFGIKSGLFTIVQEYAIKNIYMRHENWQKQLLRLGAVFGKLFKVKTYFKTIPALGEVRIAYSFYKNEVLVDLSCEIENMAGKLYILNELGGCLFDKSIINGVPADPPSGWQKIKGECELYSDTFELSFSIAERHMPDNIKSELYWGRELVTDNCCWAGFESEITCESGKFMNYIYSIVFKN